jgi:hypothetical protein
LLFFAAGLETAQHQVSITNMSPGKQLVIDYALVTSTAAGGPSSE